METKPANFRRISELILVLLLTIVPVMLSSFYVDSLPSNLNHTGISLRFISLALFYGTSIALTLYVVLNQNRQLPEIGLKFRWLDVLVALCLFAIAYYGGKAYAFLRIYFWQGGVFHTNTNINFMVTKITIPFLLFLTVSACFEEIIVRGYFMTEILHFTNSKILAILLSVALQISYHSYQGGNVMWSHTLLFGPLAIYFAFRRRLTPVVLAHLFSNLMITFGAGKF